MNLPGREKINVPLDVFDTLTVPLSVLTRRCTNSPLADWVDDTNCLNCSSALADACAENSAALRPSTVAMAMCHFFRRGNAAVVDVARVVSLVICMFIPWYFLPAPEFRGCHLIASSTPGRSAPFVRAGAQRGYSRCANDAAPAKLMPGGFSARQRRP